MYCIFYKSGIVEDLHVGDGAKVENWMDKHLAKLELIEWIQADEHELEAILRTFNVNGKPTIPVPNHRVCLWYGDIARTIHLNLISRRGFGM